MDPLYVLAILPVIGVFVLVFTIMKLGGWSVKTIWMISALLAFMAMLLIVFFLIKTHGIFYSNIIMSIIILPCATYLINVQLVKNRNSVSWKQLLLIAAGVAVILLLILSALMLFMAMHMHPVPR